MDLGQSQGDWHTSVKVAKSAGQSASSHPGTRTGCGCLTSASICQRRQSGRRTLRPREWGLELVEGKPAMEPGKSVQRIGD